MSKPKPTSFRLSPDWTIAQDSEGLVVSGGADARYRVELETDAVSFFASAKSGQSFIRQQLNNADRRVLEQLLTADIVQPVLSKQKRLRVAVVGDGAVLPLRTHAAFSIVPVGKVHDLTIVVRGKGRYAEFLERVEYPKIIRPHLFVDMAFHHTISIGPYVFPAETACVACLQGRLTNRWDDEEPPVLPQAIERYADFAAALVATELTRIAHDDTSLTNRTVAWNLQDRAVKSSLLLKVPFCPICGQNKLDGDGRLALP